ncbi:Alpha/Beta hydrolase protein [Penicillium longicatenatum]|uniref:Alpha/Beta hydrolase protein n=1 Tax=Penicillium longicatenatum TaxID=1561947 RepID=UPI0025478993|nr:Alpha/Beta hydrolase protein [Penicillium longicatenatum]KAJ5661366.1 Alpha/Beta hydrolase protein [Penicillium longicatenatum]
MDFSEFGVSSKEWLAFIAENPAAAQDGLNGNDPLQALELRDATNATREIASAKLVDESGLREKVNISTLYINSRGSHSIPLRRYMPRSLKRESSLPAIIYFHGGGFLFGSESTDDFLCANIAASLGVIVLSVIYRHTPEFQHPAQHEDAWDAMVYIEGHMEAFNIDENVGLGVLGISAGSGLAAGVVFRDLEASRAQPDREPMIKSAVLGIPWLIHVDNYPFHLFSSPEITAKVQCRDAPVIPRDRLKMFSDILSAKNPSDALLNIATLPDELLRGWPRTGFFVAGMDPLRDDGLLFAKKLELLRTPTAVHLFPGLPHGFRRWPDLLACKAFDSRMMDYLRGAMELESEAEIDGHGLGNTVGWHVYEGQDGIITTNRF